MYLVSRYKTLYKFNGHGKETDIPFMLAGKRYKATETTPGTYKFDSECDTVTVCSLKFLQDYGVECEED